VRSITTILLAAAGLSLATMSLAPAPGVAATVSVSPADTTVSVGSVFTLRLVSDAVTDLQAYQLIHGFDPNILQFLGASPGEILTGSGFAYSGFVLPDHTPPVDSVWYDAAVLGGTSHGPGVLVYLQFKAIQVGVTYLTCLHDDFRDSQNDQTFPACNQGRVVVVGITSAARTGWGRLKQTYR
jgi:hypothetical protein